METWYVLEDGAYADPRHVSSDKAGMLRHKDGRAVAMRGDVPHSRSVDPDEERAKHRKPEPKAVEHPKPEVKAKDAEPKANRQIKSDAGKATYKTR